jgi:hypothetical protein
VISRWRPATTRCLVFGCCFGTTVSESCRVAVAGG